MKAFRKRAPLIAAGVIGLGAAAALALPAGAAVSVQSESPPAPVVSVGDTGTIQARGAVVVVPVQIVCQPGSVAFLQVSVTERTGNSVTTGSSNREVSGNCTGSVQTLDFAVVPSPTIFKKGPAFAQATLQVCFFNCDTFQDAHTIQIVN